MQSKLVEALAVGELSWQDYANCRGADADLFFPERGASTRKAKAICGACDVSTTPSTWGRSSASGAVSVRESGVASDVSAPFANARPADRYR